eukprot:12895985-Prorocentrum_lima.AAC.1
MRSASTGSPHRGGTWTDESINGLLKSTALAAHRAVWHRRLLFGFKMAYGLGAKTAKRGKRS